MEAKKWVPSLTDDNAAVMGKLQELCRVIVDQDAFEEIHDRVEAFFEDDDAVALFRETNELGEELHRRSHADARPSDDEIERFEVLRSRLSAHEVASDFIEAQEELHKLQATVNAWVMRTLQLGRVPEPEDFESAEDEGCCGGHDGDAGGCGCSH